MKLVTWQPPTRTDNITPTATAGGGGVEVGFGVALLHAREARVARRLPRLSDQLAVRRVQRLLIRHSVMVRHKHRRAQGVPVRELGVAVAVDGHRPPVQAKEPLRHVGAVVRADHLSRRVKHVFRVRRAHALLDALPQRIVHITRRPGRLAGLPRHTTHRNHPPLAVPLVGVRPQPRAVLE